MGVALVHEGALLRRDGIGDNDIDGGNLRTR